MTGELQAIPTRYAGHKFRNSVLCLTLTQPWATLVAIGAKRIETRSWSTPYRGPLAIHAAKGWSRYDTLLCFDEPFRSALVAGGITTPGDLPLGAVVATCRLVACVPTTGIERTPAVDWISDAEMELGDLSDGRYAWLLADVVALPEPIPARGSLGLWRWDEAAWEAAR